jgi:hypothetical protein
MKKSKAQIIIDEESTEKPMLAQIRIASPSSCIGRQECSPQAPTSLMASVSILGGTEAD